MTETRAGDRTYRNEIVRLADLTESDDLLHGVTFESCTLVGPAVIVLMDSTMTDCVVEGTNEALFWPLGERTHVIGAIGLVGCTLATCRLQRIGIAYPPAQEDAFRRDFGF